MTEKEFEQLKVGDKVWKVSDWYTPDYKDYQFEVVSINYVGKHIIAKGEFGSNTYLPYATCYLHRSEAWGEIVKFYEEKIKDEEADMVVDKKALDRYKAELSKAREEEERGWVIINEKVYKETPYISFPSSGFQKYPTEQEAYEALAKFYERKLFKALEKCGYKFAIPCDKWIVPMLVRAEEDVFRVIYYPSHSYGCVRKQDLFDTLEEAELELERRKAK